MKEMTIYVNEARRDNNYPAILTHPLSPPSRPIFFSEADAYAVHSRTMMLWSWQCISIV